MTAREHEIYNDICTGVADPRSQHIWGLAQSVARVMAAREEKILARPLPGAAGEQVQTEEPPIHFVGVICGSRAQRSSVYRDDVTCPDCLERMQQPQPSAPPADEIASLLPPTFYADLPTAERVRHLLRQWQRLVAAQPDFNDGAPPAAPEPGKSRGEEVAEKMVRVKSGQVLFQIREQGEVRYLESWIGGNSTRGAIGRWSAEELCSDLRAGLAWIIDAEHAAAAGEAWRKALRAAMFVVAGVRNDITKADRLGQECIVKAYKAVNRLLDAAAAPAGEGSKANG